MAGERLPQIGELGELAQLLTWLVAELHHRMKRAKPSWENSERQTAWALRSKPNKQGNKMEEDPTDSKVFQGSTCQLRCMDLIWLPIHIQNCSSKTCEIAEEVWLLTGDAIISRNYYTSGMVMLLWLFLFKSPYLLEILKYAQMKLHGLWDLHRHDPTSGEWTV